MPDRRTPTLNGTEEIATMATHSRKYMTDPTSAIRLPTS